MKTNSPWKSHYKTDTTKNRNSEQSCSWRRNWVHSSKRPARKKTRQDSPTGELPRHWGQGQRLEHRPPHEPHRTERCSSCSTRTARSWTQNPAGPLTGRANHRPVSLLTVTRAASHLLVQEYPATDRAAALGTRRGLPPALARPGPWASLKLRSHTGNPSEGLKTCSPLGRTSVSLFAPSPTGSGDVILTNQDALFGLIKLPEPGALIYIGMNQSGAGGGGGQSSLHQPVSPGLQQRSL